MFDAPWSMRCWRGGVDAVLFVDVVVVRVGGADSDARIWASCFKDPDSTMVPFRMMLMSSASFLDFGQDVARQ